MAVGFIGLVFHRNRNVETDQKKLGRERAKSYIPEPERDDLPEDEERDGPLFWRSDKHLSMALGDISDRSRDAARSIFEHLTVGACALAHICVRAATSVWFL